MKKLLVIALMLGLFAGLFACRDSAEISTATEAIIESTTQIPTTDDSREYGYLRDENGEEYLYYIEETADKGPYWSFTSISFPQHGTLGHLVAFWDKDGNTFFDGYGWWPGWWQVEQINETIVDVLSGGGSGAWTNRYFDVERGLVSPIYFKTYAAGYGKVVYADRDYESEDRMLRKLVVHDMFDPELERMTFVRNFWFWETTGNDFPDIGVEFEAFPFKTIEFPDRNYLHIEYMAITDTSTVPYSAELVTETLKLN